MHKSEKEETEINSKLCCFLWMRRHCCFKIFEASAIKCEDFFIFHSVLTSFFSQEFIYIFLFFLLSELQTHINDYTIQFVLEVPLHAPKF